ncbi:hypothetical protein T310_5866, partial [Rasamsonia emersonii CBS 393.64]
ELVTDGALPHCASTARGNPPPPQRANARLRHSTVPVRQHVLFPYALERLASVIFLTLGGSSLGGLAFFCKSVSNPFNSSYQTMDEPASRAWAIIFLYSLRCLCSSFGSFGGSQLGRVRLRTFSFSLLTGKGSIIMFDFCNGGRSGMLPDPRFESILERREDLPLWSFSSRFRSVSSAWSSSASVKTLTSSDNSAIARL